MTPLQNRLTLFSILITTATLPPLVLPLSLTITTFNMLAAIHRSMPSSPETAKANASPNGNPRESERREWWQPRAEEAARFIAKEFASSDAVLLQEWWFREEFVEIFDRYTDSVFDRVAEQRPGGRDDEFPLREDGMAVLINKKGRLKLVGSQKVLTGPNRIAQIVQCREHSKSSSPGRPVFIANVHLSFPSHVSKMKNERRQSTEVQLVGRALSKASKNIRGAAHSSQLHFVGGDFNSDSCGMAAMKLESEPNCFVNCASAKAEQALTSGSGGRVNIGVTHRTHRGEDVSVDHIFARCTSVKEANVDYLSRSSGPSWQDCSLALRRLGYLDSQKTRVVDCQRRHLILKGDKIISDHRPVTATIHWPRCGGDEEIEDECIALNDVTGFGFVHMPLDPLEPPWGVCM